MKTLLLFLVLSTIAFGVGANKVWRVGTSAGSAGWGAVNLASTSGVTNTLPVGNGGTGATTLTSGGLLVGNGVSAVSAITALTRALAPVLARGISSSCSNFSSGSSGTLQVITNLSQTVTLTGGDVLLVMQPDGSTNGSSITHGALSAWLSFYRDSTELGRINLAASATLGRDENTYSFLDTSGTTGSVTYSMKMNDGGSAYAVNYYKLAVRELY